MRTLATGVVIAIAATSAAGGAAIRDPGLPDPSPTHAAAPGEALDPFEAERGEAGAGSLLRWAGNAVCNPRVEVCEK